MPQLNPEAGVPTVQLVGLETTKGELLKIYLEVYKLHRLPGSPPGELAILEEIMASVLDHPQSEEDKMLEATAQPCPGGSHSSRSSTPHRRRNDDSVEKRLAMVCEVHQKALAAVSTLEREIERLNHTQAHSQSRGQPKSRDCQWPSWEGWKKRHHTVWFKDQHVSSQSADPKTQSGEEGSKGGGSDLGELPELKPMVASFL